jgi:hypothetical protein
VTVRDWILRRAPQPPMELRERVLAALGSDADADQSHTATLCLAAAERALKALIVEGRFARENAPDLLAIDALTTYAFEHASDPKSREDLDALSAHATRQLGQLVTARD